MKMTMDDMKTELAKLDWHPRFAWLPVKIAGEWGWLCPFESKTVHASPWEEDRRWSAQDQRKKEGR